MKKIVVLENIRSAYNVGNIIRTADALGWEVWICGYTPNPFSHKKVIKTSLGAENNIGLMQFDYADDVISYAQQNNIKIIAAETSKNAINLNDFSRERNINQDIAIIFGNEIDGVLNTTLEKVDEIVYIPMKGIKESLNVGQTTAIFMWELSKQ